MEKEKLDAYKKLTEDYDKFFIGYFSGTKEINTKFAVISILGHLTKEIRKKKPTTTSYEVIKAIEPSLIDEIAMPLGAVTEGFMYGTEEYELFGMTENKDMVKFVKDTLITLIPF